jgi:hypothetical protein
VPVIFLACKLPPGLCPVLEGKNKERITSSSNGYMLIYNYSWFLELAGRADMEQRLARGRNEEIRGNLPKYRRPRLDYLQW